MSSTAVLFGFQACHLSRTIDKFLVVAERNIKLCTASEVSNRDVFPNLCRYEKYDAPTGGLNKERRKTGDPFMDEYDEIDEQIMHLMVVSGATNWRWWWFDTVPSFQVPEVSQQKQLLAGVTCYSRFRDVLHKSCVSPVWMPAQLSVAPASSHNLLVTTLAGGTSALKMYPQQTSNYAFALSSFWNPQP